MKSKWQSEKWTLDDWIIAIVSLLSSLSGAAVIAFIIIAAGRQEMGVC